MGYTVLFLPDGISVTAEENTTWLQAQILAGLRPDAPCGGKGTCGKCKVWINGQDMLACRTLITGDMTVRTEPEAEIRILTEGLSVQTQPDGKDAYVLAFDIGTTTVVAYLLDGHTGTLLAQSSCRNPQGQFGADVISRVQQVMKDGGDALSGSIRTAMQKLTAEA